MTSVSLKTCLNLVGAGGGPKKKRTAKRIVSSQAETRKSEGQVLTSEEKPASANEQAIGGKSEALTTPKKKIPITASGANLRTNKEESVTKEEAPAVQVERRSAFVPRKDSDDI